MGLREELQKRIERKQQEIHELRLQIREAEAYIQGLQDTIRLVPKEASTTPAEISLRPGTSVSKSRDAIKAAGKPLHITEILRAIGRPVDKNNRVALSGSLAAYVRKGEVFARPLPNTFSLLELGQNHKKQAEEPPENFGLIEADDTEKIDFE